MQAWGCGINCKGHQRMLVKPSYSVCQEQIGLGKASPSGGFPSTKPHWVADVYSLYLAGEVFIVAGEGADLKLGHQEAPLAALLEQRQHRHRAQLLRIGALNYPAGCTTQRLNSQCNILDANLQP